MNDKNKHPVFAASADAHILYSHLKRAAEERPTDVVTYDELGAAIQRDVRADARSVLVTARRIAEREDGLVFETVRGIGVRLVPKDEIHRVAAAARRKSAAAAKRGLKKVLTADLTAMSQEARTRTVAEITVLEFQSRAGRAAAVERLRGKIDHDQLRLSAAEAALEMFK